jgi:hypothetical protein
VAVIAVGEPDWLRAIHWRWQRAMGGLHGVPVDDLERLPHQDKLRIAEIVRATLWYLDDHPEMARR